MVEPRTTSVAQFPSIQLSINADRRDGQYRQCRIMDLPVGVMIAAGGQLVMCHRFCSFGLGLGLVHRPIRVVRRRVDRI